MAPSVELSKRLFAFTSLCGALSADRATPFHGKSMENVSGRGKWHGGRGRLAKDTLVHAAMVMVVMLVRYRLDRIYKESCFLFQLGDKVNSELQIITSVFNKVIYRGEYNICCGEKRASPLLFF